MTKKEEIIKKIETEYDWYTSTHAHMPNVAYAFVKWEEDNKEYSEFQSIGFGNEENDNVYDDENILYYVSDIDNLLNLVNENNGSDFIITDFVNFDRLKDECDN